jgi:acyl phosphate:glycerol-3-phosphate acyltransferase
LLTTYLTIALVSYLLGSIPFGYILVKLFLKQDIRQTGSGNIGATNVARSGAKGLAIATLLLDAGKGALAVAITIPLALKVYGPSYIGAQFHAISGPASAVMEGGTIGAVCLAMAAFSAIVGHMFPLWLRFKGGKGVATAIGAFLLLAPEAALTATVVFGLVLWSTRFVSAGSVLASAAFPVLWWFLSSNRLIPSFLVYTYGRIACTLLIIASSLLIILKHHENIRRLLAGTEPKFGRARVSTDPIQAEKNA